MNFLRFILHIIKRSYIKLNIFQKILITILILSNLLIGIISFIKIILPFTYVAI